jgi:hypothetical protein
MLVVTDAVLMGMESTSATEAVLMGMTEASGGRIIWL